MKRGVSDRCLEVLLSSWFVLVSILYAHFYIIPKFNENLSKIISVMGIGS